MTSSLSRNVSTCSSHSNSSSSSESALSRASSTASVQAVPFRLTPFTSPALSRTASSQITRANRPFSASSVDTIRNQAYLSSSPASSGNASPPEVSHLHLSPAPNSSPPVGSYESATFRPRHLRSESSQRPTFIPLPSKYGSSQNLQALASGLITPGGTGTGLATPALSAMGFLRPNSGGSNASTNGSMSRSASMQSIGVNMHKRAADFELGDILGEGSYSTVFQVTDKYPPHRQYALKVLDKKHIIKERKVKYVNVEKETLTRLDRHPGFTRLFFTFHDESSLYFVLELAPHGEILKYIQELGSFDIETARYYAAQTLAAVEYLHSKGIIHRDLKPENILLDERKRAKIADFGSAKLLDWKTGETKKSEEVVKEERANSFVGTAQYVSPELLSSSATSKVQAPLACADLWAFGCVLYQFIAGRSPFRAANEYLTFQKITKLDYTFPTNFDEDAADLIRRLLVLDPTERLGASPERGGIKELKSHKFFESINWDTIWDIDPPEMKSGIVVAPPKTKIILEYDSGSDNEDDLDAFDHSPQTDDVYESYDQPDIPPSLEDQYKHPVGPQSPVTQYFDPRNSSHQIGIAM